MGLAAVELKINDTDIPYRSLFLVTLLTSVITVDLGELNLSIGDILLMYLNCMLLLSLKYNMKMDQHRKKWMQRILITITAILFLSYLSLQNYILNGYGLSRGIIELIKFTVAINYGIVFSIYFAYARKEDVRLFLKWVMLSGIIVAVTGIVGVLLYQIGIVTPFVMNGQRAKGTLSDTNIMAIYMLTIAPLVFIYYRKTKALAVFLLFAASVLATSSKAAVVVSVFLVFCFLLLLLLTNKMNKFFRYLFIAVSLLSAVYIAVNNLAVFHLLSQRLSELRSGDHSVVTTGRTDLWLVSLALMANPMFLIFGIGYGAFANYMVNVDVPYYLTEIKLVHNTYLSMFVETGVVTFIIMTGLSVYLLIRTFIEALVTRHYVHIFLLISQLSLIIGMNQVNLQNNRYVYYLFIFYFFAINKRHSALMTSIMERESGH
ncbi:O-antigen ligase family protein [Alkalibacterium pelagium]|uniref:O-antigen ligase n=1 Tax=Alkalibacterium pelagium TaxID=426702 RepID=A0A1H7HSU9_9LACT|nr:O-antigen ligase family protein [Alkalibacterium pelagium]GEN50387.1 hypothetical protein APE02nite_10520 [Alkalibacterium pelagium]SEK52110.1 O-antigen ligase [Alkalibacterium pelagium]